MTKQALRPVRYTESFRVHVSPTVYQEYRKLAANEASSVSHVARRALTEWLLKKGTSLMPRLKDPAGPAGEAADMAIEAALIAKREAAKIPRPDPRDDPVFQMRASMESIAARSSMPRRNRWRPLVELDRKVADLHARRAELSGQLAEIDARLASVADSDRRQLALWVAAGEPGRPPQPSAPQLGEERVQVVRMIEAADIAISDALEQRVQHVEKNRPRMVRQAHSEVETHRADYLRLVGALRTVRAALVEARSVEIWASLFPNELAGSAAGNETNLCLGLMRPVKESLGVTHQLGIEQMFSALEVDAHTIAEKLTPEQRKELGTTAAPTPEAGAMWHTDDAYQAWAKEKQRELNELARWAHPAQLQQLGREMRDD